MTSAVEQYPERAVDPLEEEFGGRLSNKLLLEAVRDIANNRRAFAKKLVDEISFNVGTSDVSEDGMAWPNDDDPSKLNSVNRSSLETTYTFRAERIKVAEMRDDDDEPVARPAYEFVRHQTFIEFTFGVVMTHVGIELPAHLAVDFMAERSVDDEPEEILGGIDMEDDEDDEDEFMGSITPEEAIERGKTEPWTLKHRIDFVIATNDRTLVMHDSHIYLSEYDEIVSATCSCADPDCDYSRMLLDEETMEEAERATSAHGEKITESGRTFEPVETNHGRVYALHPMEDAIPTDSPEDALKLWETMEGWRGLKTLFPTRKELAQQEDQELRQAFKILSLTMAALREQAGIS